MDYTSSPIVTIEIGNVKVQTGTFNLIHIIDLEQYEALLDAIHLTIEHDLTRKGRSYPFLSQEENSLRYLLSQLKPKKTKRAINALGTAWKWLAGTPDHEDYKIVTDKINDILINNNQQVIINKSIFERISNLTHITNVILSEAKLSDAHKLELEKNIERKLKYIKEELTNVDYSIQWAKAGVINSFILSNDELNVIKEALEKQNIPYLNIIEAIELSDVKIASNLSSIIYIVKFPITSEETCKLLTLKPVKLENKIIKLEYENVVVCNENIFGVKSNCKNINNLVLCKQDNLAEVTKSSCIPNLIKGYSSNCTITNSHHVPTIEEITPGLLLINSYNGSLKIDNDVIQLQGTFLIRYDNASLMIQQKNYTNKNKLFVKPLPAVIKSLGATGNHEEVLSLQYLNELNIANIQQINALNTKYKISLFTGSSVIVISLIILIALAARKIITNRKSKVTIEINTKNSEDNHPKPMQRSTLSADHTSMLSNEDAACFKGGGVNTMCAQTITQPFSDISPSICAQTNTQPFSAISPKSLLANVDNYLTSK